MFYSKTIEKKSHYYYHYLPIKQPNELQYQNTHQDLLLSPIIFDNNLKTISVSFFIADLNLLSCEFDNFTFKLLSFYTLYSTKSYLKELHL